jgi:DNA-binding XRE family transcriptional regulator
LIVVEVPDSADPPTTHALQARRRIGRNVTAARMPARLSQEDLAKLAGVSRQTVYRIETRVRAARVDWLVVIADALQVPLADLVRDV